MKRFFAVPLAAFVVAACSESTSPNSTADLSPSYAKPTSPQAPCSNCPIQGSYDFNGGTIVADGNTSVTTELQPGITGSADAPAVVTAPSTEKFLGRFENTRTMVVINVAPGANYNVNLDLYVIGSWDGRGKQAQQGAFLANVVEVGTRCTSGGSIAPLFKTTFSNQYTVQQDYPNQYLSGGYKAGTGSEAIDELGYRTHPELSNTPSFRSFGDATYNLTFAGANPCNGDGFALTISTSNPEQQSMWDESWGVDNIVIRTGT